MTLLDAYALIALVADEPAADEVEAILRAGGTRVVVANLAEAVDVLQRVHEHPPDAVRDAIEPLLLANVLLAAVSDATHAWSAPRSEQSTPTARQELSPWPTASSSRTGWPKQRQSSPAIPQSPR